MFPQHFLWRSPKLPLETRTGHVFYFSVNDNVKLEYLERKPHQSQLVFMTVLYPGQIGIWSVVVFFVETGKLENLKKNSQSKVRTNTNSTHT